ncbi:MAG TPA: CopD family protein [Flavobacteriales bacterium]|nr:CopD family protein [Flavobacteriales bacterium]HNU56327.1 CopD family protein [Flavobacteriales bacterium]
MEPTTTEIPALLKALHLFALVVFFAGTFHIVRLFVAHRTAMAKWEPDRKILLDQFCVLERRALYYTNWPALIAFLIMGGWVLYLRPALLKEPFMHILMGYMALVFAYHLSVHRLQRRLQRGEVKWSAWLIGLWGQGATLLLFILIVLLIFRDHMGWIWGSAGLLIVGAVVMLVGSRLRSSTPGTPKDA